MVMVGLFENSGLLKQLEKRFSTPGAHPDTGFEPKKGLLSFPCWPLIHRHIQLHADVLRPSI